MFLLVLFFAPKKRTVGVWGYPPLTETGDYEIILTHYQEWGLRIRYFRKVKFMLHVTKSVSGKSTNFAA